MPTQFQYKALKIPRTKIDETVGTDPQTQTTSIQTTNQDKIDSTASTTTLDMRNRPVSAPARNYRTINEEIQAQTAYNTPTQSASRLF